MNMLRWDWPWKVGELQKLADQRWESAEYNRKEKNAKEATVKEMRRRIQEAIDSNNLSTCMYILSRLMEETRPKTAWEIIAERMGNFGEGECQNVKERGEG